MECNEPHFRSRRPLKIGVLGSEGVGKTTIALQFVTNEIQVGTSSTTIEDIYRKEARIIVNDNDAITRIQQSLTDTDNENEMLLEETFCTSASDAAKRSTDIDISLSLKIIDTAGYKVPGKCDNHSSRSLLKRLTLRKKQGSYHVSSTNRKKCEDQVVDVKPRTKSFELNEAKAKERLENCMSQSDGLVLVYNVLDETTFATACEIRNKFVQLRTSMQCSDEEQKKATQSNFFHNLLFSCCAKDEEIVGRIPPIFLVGTHADARVDKTSQIFDTNFLHGNASASREERKVGRKKRKLGKTFTTGPASIYPQDVYPVITDWKECKGFAEITSTDVAIVQQIFEKLNLAILIPSQE